MIDAAGQVTDMQVLLICIVPAFVIIFGILFSMSSWISSIERRINSIEGRRYAEMRGWQERMR